MSRLTAHVDVAPGEVFHGAELMLWGWCLEADSGVPPRVFARVTACDSVWVRGARAIARPDVRAAHPGQASTGFVWTFPVVRRGPVAITLVGVAADGSEEELGRWETLAVPPHEEAAGAPAAQPADFVCVVDRPLAGAADDRPFGVSGWCARLDGQHVAGLRVRVGEAVFPLTYGLPRKDVHRAHDGRAGTLYCGFSGTVPEAPRGRPVTLEAAAGAAWVEVRSLDFKPLRGLQRVREVLRDPAPGTPLRERFYYHILPKAVGSLRWTLYGDFLQHAPREVEGERFPAPSAAPAEALPRFAIVTPSYNQAAYLPATMASVLDQPGVRVDYIVMDGGSTDGSVDLIRAQEARLAYWTSGPDGGQSAAVAAGLARAQGGPDDLMAYLNSDDTLMPGALRFVAEYMAAHPEVDAVYGHRVIIDAEGRETGRWFTHRHNPGITRWVDLVPQETLFWRRRVYERVGGIDPSFRFALDWDLIVRLIEAGARMVRVPWFLGCFRMHETSKTATQSESVGAQEVERIRRRVHGRAVGEDEVLRRWYRAVAESNMLAWMWARGRRW